MNNDIKPPDTSIEPAASSRAGDGGSIVFQPGRGYRSSDPAVASGFDGSIVFKRADGSEALRLNHDGAFLVNGVKVADDREVYEGLRVWLWDAGCLSFAVRHPLAFDGPIVTGFEPIQVIDPATGGPFRPTTILRPGTPVHAEVLRWFAEGIPSSEWKARLLPWFDRERWCWRDAPVEATP